MHLLAINFNLELVWEQRQLLWEAFLVTLRLFAVTLVVSIPPAALLAAARAYGPAWLRLPITWFVYAARSLPAVLLILVIFYALPFVGPTFSAFVSVVLALAITQVVYFSEVFRGALKAVDTGQLEASASLGLRPWTTGWRVVGPQAAAVAAPTFTNSCIQLMQNTTIASGVAVYDLLGRAQNIAVNSLDGTAVVLVAAVYVAVLVPFVRLARRLERRVSIWQGSVA